MNRRRTSTRRGSERLLHAWRALFVVTALSVSLMLAFFPGYAPAASAETAPTPSSEIATAEPTAEPQPPNPTPDPTPLTTPDPTPAPTDPSPDPTPTTSPEPTPGATPTVPPSLAGVTVELSTDLPSADPRRADPGARVELTASVTTTADLTDATLTVSLPDGWLVVDSGSGAPDPGGRSVAWVLETVASATGVTRSVVLTAPETAAGATAEHLFGVRIQVGSDFIDGAPLVIIVAPPVSVVSVSAGRVTRVGEPPDYLDPGQPLRGVPRFEVFRVRFEMINGGETPYWWQPQLEYGSADGTTFRLLPEGEASPGAPFYAAPEWIRLPGGGTAPGPTSAWEPGRDGAPDTFRSMGLNPLSSISLEPGSTTLVEFSVRATVDAEYEATYLLRLTDAGEMLPGTVEATVILASSPPVMLSPGQQSGVPADAPPRALRASYTAAGLHSPNYDLATDNCAACHRAHVAQGTMLNAQPTEYALCVACHNGVDAPDVASAYAGVPANDPLTRSYYQHDPTVVTGPLGTANACSDCHNPHDSTSTAPVMGAGGWSASGRIAGASGVAVTNGPGAVTYALVNRVSLEYQLCFKCHAGSAQRPSNEGQPPSRMSLDKGIEFDPRNPSYHPIEAPGTNGSTQINASLALTGTSAYKRWAFDSNSTIRCVNCHADARLDPRTPENVLKPPDTNLPVHASPERSILIEPYRDRTLMGPIEPYDDANFALCYVCHAEAPFVDTSGAVRPDTNFRYHGLHVSSEELQDHGNPATSIDVPGNGAGTAICAECHFRIHSTAYSVDGQAPGARLVNFAPSVTGRTGLPLSWQLKTDTTSGSCSLRCHSEPHTETY